jgi:hypothetical protein
MGILSNIWKCPVCSPSRYKNNSGYCGGDSKGPGDGNKRKRKGARIVFVGV